LSSSVFGDLAPKDLRVDGPRLAKNGAAPDGGVELPAKPVTALWDWDQVLLAIFSFALSGAIRNAA